MASKRKDKLVLGLFENRDALEKLLVRLRKHSSLRDKTFIFANEWQQPAIDELITAPLKSSHPNLKFTSLRTRGNQRVRHYSSSNRFASEQWKERRGLVQTGSLPPLLAKYNVNLPDSKIVVGLSSSRASALRSLFKQLGAIEVYYGGVPRVVSSAGQSNHVPLALTDIIQRMIPSRTYARAMGIPSLVSTSLVDAANHYIDIEFDEGLTAVASTPYTDFNRKGFSGIEVFKDVTDSPIFAPPKPPAASPASAPGQESLIELREGNGVEPPPTLPPDGPDGPTERFIEGRFPSLVQPGKKFYLQVRIAVEPAGGTRTTPVNSGVLPEGQDAKVLLLLHAPDFTIAHDQRDRTINVPAKKNSDFAIWELTPNIAGTLTLSVTAYYGSAALGELNIQVGSLDGVATGESTTKSSAVQFHEPDPGEITLEIRYDPKNLVYNCSFISIRLHTPDMELKPLKRPPEDVFSSLISQLNDMARGVTKIDPAEMRDYLRGKGLELWLEFIPEDLQTLFWNERANIKRMTIRSGGDPIPWELLYPTEPGKSPDPSIGFLGEAFDLTRWRFGKTPTTSIRNGRICFVLPPSAPKKAFAEIDNLKNIVGGDSVVVGSLKELRGVLQSADFGILHFACHNSFDQTTARIKMPDGPLEPSTLRNYLNKFDNPFIFMNACRTDGQTQSYTRLGGWADSFLDTGVGAFVGSLWEIRDDSAAQFAATLYGQLKTRSLGEAATAARKSIDNGDGDPTWLAYSVYGNAEAKITG